MEQRRASNWSGRPKSHRAGPPPVPVNLSIRRYYQSSDSDAEDSGEAWTKKPEIPSSEEVWSLPATQEDGYVHMLPNIITGPWQSSDEYLQAHYELLREDSVAPLRDAVACVRSHPQMMDSGYVCIYEKVHIVGVTCAHTGVGFRIQFSTRRAGKNIVWDYSSRLISGSIVALSPADDAFQSKCIIAVVAARQLDRVKQQPPEIDIFWARPNETEFDPQVEWIMVEARNSYYEASRYTLRALQKLSGESFPLEDHICRLNPEVDAPEYVVENPIMRTQSIFDMPDAQDTVDVLNAWPKLPIGDLDPTQWAALKQILTKKLAIVQGPPGTGKTFVSVLALRLLVANMRSNDPPILIAAQTNHALDQLLTHLSQYEEKFIRLGGRSNSQQIKEHTLYEVRKARAMPGIAGGILVPALNHCRSLSSELASRLAEFNHETEGTILPASFFVKWGVLSEEQYRHLEAGSKDWVQPGETEDVEPMMFWLGSQKVPFEVEYEQTKFHLEEDDIDLQYEQLKELEAEKGLLDEDRDTLKGKRLFIKEAFCGKEVGNVSEAHIQKFLKYPDLWDVPTMSRGFIYNALRRIAKKKVIDDIRILMQRYEENAQNIQIGKWESNELYLREAKVIGLTTTGLSKYRGLLSSLNPKVILIEEAAEVIEAPIAAACFESLEHLILVGDHKQLKGTCAVRGLMGEPFNLDVSMFERLVRNGIGFSILGRQRRMAPEISRLLDPIYGALEDHPSVLQLPNVPGMGDVRSFFFDHRWPEKDDSLSSKLNDREAKMLAGFFVYLVMNGVDVAKITVLSFYNGQRKNILKLLRQNPYLEDQYVNVVTVDSYQGEENDIVLLSLVRNGTIERNIGFMSVENRICVAISRARLGFFIFGNAEYLSNASRLWRRIASIMAHDRRLGSSLPLTCQQHGRKTIIRAPGDWASHNGGCRQACDEALPCGHRCRSRCHPTSHDKMACGEPCPTVLPCGHRCSGGCPSGHQCHCRCPQAMAAREEEAEERHRAFIKKYRDYASGGAREHDKALLERAMGRDGGW